MSTIVPQLSSTLLSDLAARIRSQHRGLLRELSLEPAGQGIIIRGRATSFYGKQLALHETQRQCRIPVVANHVTVN